MAFKMISFKWVFLITLPNCLTYYFIIISTFMIFNCFNLTFWSLCVFISYKLKSLSTQKFELYQLDQKKINMLVVKNIIHFNQLLQIFKSSQLDFDYTIITYFSGILSICFSFPYILFFGNDDLLSFLICLLLYSQSMVFIIWSVIKSNEVLDDGVSLNI